MHVFVLVSRDFSRLIHRDPLIAYSCFRIGFRLLQSETGCEEGMDTLLLSGVDEKQRKILDRNPEAIFGMMSVLLSLSI